MSRLMLVPIAVSLAAGAVLLGTGDQTSSTPAGDRAEQRQVQVDIVRSGN